MQCYGCKYHIKGNTEYGQNYPDECTRVAVVSEKAEDGETGEQISILFESILFKLSELNNCPFFTDKIDRRSILNLKP